ncbi:hypothetical protein [Marinicella sp. W31]|uniref:hypothetical protein n=1 Tax=Marinicella sp. W31 TaxID=3023713 RepID=UPI00375739E1
MKRNFSMAMVCLLCVCASVASARGNQSLSSIVKVPDNSSFNQLTKGKEIPSLRAGCYVNCYLDRIECEDRPGSTVTGIGGDGGGTADCYTDWIICRSECRQ